MKTMRNEYRDLKKENDLIFSTLAEYDRDTITEIISVADNTRGIGDEIELIRKDLIAMAAQAEARRDYLPSVIGDVDVFKRNLLASMPRPKLADYMALVILRTQLILLKVIIYRTVHRKLKPVIPKSTSHIFP